MHVWKIDIGTVSCWVWCLVQAGQTHCRDPHENTTNRSGPDAWCPARAPPRRSARLKSSCLTVRGCSDSLVCRTSHLMLMCRQRGPSGGGDMLEKMCAVKFLLSHFLYLKLYQMTYVLSDRFLSTRLEYELKEKTQLTVKVGPKVQPDWSRAVLQYPVGVFLGASVQWNVLAFPSYAPLQLISQLQQKMF